MWDWALLEVYMLYSNREQQIPSEWDKVREQEYGESFLKEVASEHAVEE